MKKVAIKSRSPQIYYLVCKGLLLLLLLLLVLLVLVIVLSNDDVGVARGTTVSEEILTWADFKAGGFVKEKLGRGYRRATH